MLVIDKGWRLSIKTEAWIEMEGITENVQKFIDFLEFNQNSKLLVWFFKKTESPVSRQLINNNTRRSAIYVLPFDMRNDFNSYRFVIEWKFLSFALLKNLYTRNHNFDLTFFSLRLTTITICLHILSRYIWHLCIERQPL